MPFWLDHARPTGRRRAHVAGKRHSAGSGTTSGDCPWVKLSLEATPEVDQQALIAEVQSAVEARLAHVHVRSEAVIADA